MTTERRTREARTELTDVAVSGGDKGSEEESEARDDPRVVTLSDGRVFRLKPTHALHDMRLAQALSRLGWNAMALGQEGYSLLRALGAVESIDDKPFQLPKDRGGWEFYLRNLKSADSLLLVNKYLELNMPEALLMGAGGATFPSDDGGGD